MTVKAKGRYSAEITHQPHQFPLWETGQSSWETITDRISSDGQRGFVVLLTIMFSQTVARAVE